MRTKKFARYFGVFMTLNILIEVISPTVALALTNGSTQPEFIGFEPANSSEMVDLFTGDFKYNIPLMDVDGYPLNLSYHAGPNMEGEASWVGLGWSMNPGVMNRMVKGLPDDFKGESVASNTHIKPHISMGVGVQYSAWFGANLDYSNVGVGGKIGADGAIVLSYNNYKGYGLEVEMDAHLSLTAKAGVASISTGGGVGMSLSSQDGGELSYNYSGGVGVGFLSANLNKGGSINTRTGAATKTYGGDVAVSAQIGKASVSIGVGTSHTIPTGPVAYSPRNSHDYEGFGFGLSVKAGFWGYIQGYLNGFPLPLSLEGGILTGYKGFYNSNKLVSSNKTLPAFGYLYSELAGDNSLMDYNTFKDGPIMQETPNINLASHTYDIYSASAQGMGSNFRSFRSDVGVLHDPTGTTVGKNRQVGTEIGVGIFLHFLLEISKVVSNGKSGNWNTHITNSLAFKDLDIKKPINRFYEKNYFKELGEISERDGAFSASLGGEAAVSPKLQKVGPDYEAQSTISGAPRLKRDVRNTYIESFTGSQAANWGYEKTYNLYDTNSKQINLTNRLVTPSQTGISRTTKQIQNNSVDVSHHISEMSLTNSSGDIYVYGIPVYNLEKKKVLFNAADRTNAAYTNTSWFPTASFAQNPLPISNAYQMVQYTGGAPDITDNYRGVDNFYEDNITPAYATSYLLNSILSSDYQDITGDGPSYDDLGNFTKFNYFKAADYKWREPYCFPGAENQYNNTDWAKGTPLSSNNLQANYEKGLIADEHDDKAFYESGSRESYYAHSIETKNYVAFFETSPRLDFKGASEDGTPTNPQNLQLDAIKLYSKSEIISKGGNIANAVPIKTVRFEYNYELCPGTFNSEYHSNFNQFRGKLTLKKVYFTYGSSEKSALSPYEFTYDTNSNFSYDPRSVDRWGNYMPNVNGYSTGNPGTLNNIEFPYSIQNKSLADDYAAAWNLTEIKTPSGSKIRVSYESDDYAYVQNEQAGQMLTIKNVVEGINSNDDPSSYTSNANIKESRFIIVDLQKLYERGIPVNTYSTLTLANNFAKSNLVKMNKELYYKAFVKLGGPANSFGLKKDYWEYISGYGKVEDVGVFTSANPGNVYTASIDNVSQPFYKYAFIRVKKEVAYDSKDVFPITIASWDYMRNYLPRIAYPGSEPANMGDNSHKPLKQFKNALVGLGVALADFVNGATGKPNKRFYNKNFGVEMDYAKSFVRAYIPLKKKMGGGYRVKKIITEDRWDVMTANQNIPEQKTTYGQVYDYTIKEGKFNVSSGVASYEPLVGGDENTMRQPIPFEIEKRMAPNDHFYQETPYAEHLYPGPLVGYSKVTVTTLPDPGAQTTPNVCKIGRTEFEFYTSKDFPIIYQTSGLSKQLLESDLIEDFVTITKSYKIFHAAQGHVIKFNDMHGKLKAILTYAEDNYISPISGVRYFYKQSGGVNGSKQLITNALTINEKNQIGTAVMSRDIDLSVDVKENLTESTTFGNSFLLEIGLKLFVWIFPCPPAVCVAVTPVPFPKTISNTVIYGQQKFGVKTSTMTKVIQQYGILERVETFDNKSKTTIDNLLWDRNTGDVVLTKETNNLDQSVFNFNYPAYWAYTDMGHEFRRDNVELLCTPSSSTTIWNANSGELFIASVNNPRIISYGDEVRINEVDTLGNIINPVINTIDNDNRFWVMSNYTNPTVSFLLVDKNGIPVNQSNFPVNANNNYVIKVVKPINKNNLSMSAGGVSSLVTPISGFGITYNAAKKIVDAEVQEFCTGSSFFLNNSISQQTITNVAPNYSLSTFNEIIAGFYGNYRPSKSYKYNVNRDYSNSQPNVNNDGLYNSFSPFWVYSVPFGKWGADQSDQRWIKMNNNKYYSPYGNLLETEDAILVPHSQRQSFNHTLPALSATNAKVDEVGFDSFEDYSIYGSLQGFTHLYNNDYLGVYKHVTTGANPPIFDGANAHTGRTSLYFGPNKLLNMKHYYQRGLINPPYNADVYNACNPTILDCSNLNLRENKYITSMWVKGVTPAMNYASLVNFSGVITYTAVNNSVNTINVTPQLTNQNSPIINGWQKLDFVFSLGTIPPNNAATIELKIQSGTNSFYLDDYRIQPFNSSMTCNVFDPIHLRLWAQLDDRNYATFLEYDTEGMLVRKKKETEKGIYSIQETRKGIVK
jgi:hypothetical protein